MSGGHFDYIDLRLFNMIDDTLENDIINSNDNTRHYPLKLKELSKAIGDLIHAYDWFISGDTGEDTYLKEFKQVKTRLKEQLNDGI
jgi:hypothetical protein